MKKRRVFWFVSLTFGLLLPLIAEVQAAAGSTLVSSAGCANSKRVSKKACAATKRIAMVRARREANARRAAAQQAAAFQRGLHSSTTENIANDNSLGEDPGVRKVAREALGSHAGTVVVMDSKSGQLLTVVNQEWAIKEAFKPCSVIKLVTAAAGLDEGVITEDGSIAGTTSSLKLDFAIAKSNNAYFQQVGQRLTPDKFSQTARELGLGRKTGVNIPDEPVGKIPYRKGSARVFSHADGTEVTPLQLAVMVTAIANGGKRIVPHFNSGNEPIGESKLAQSEQVNLSPKSLASLLPGMKGTAEFGTAHKGVDASLGIAGKTGSCIGNGSWVGLFASVAPVHDPKYTVVVVTRGNGERGARAAAVTGAIYNYLLKPLPDVAP